MVVWQKAVFIALGIACQQVLIGMNKEEEKEIDTQNQVINYKDEFMCLQKELRRQEDIKYKVLEILKFTRNKRECEKSDNCMINLGFWLEEERKRHTPEEWKYTVANLYLEASQQNRLIEDLRGDCLSCSGAAFTRTKQVLEVINTIAHALKPGEKCTQLLVDEVRKVIEEHRLILTYGPYYKEYLDYEAKK